MGVLDDKRRFRSIAQGSSAAPYLGGEFGLLLVLNLFQDLDHLARAFQLRGDR
jgi:hypothetical protein